MCCHEKPYALKENTTSGNRAAAVDMGVCEQPHLYRTAEPVGKKREALAHLYDPSLVVYESYVLLSSYCINMCLDDGLIQAQKYNFKTVEIKDGLSNFLFAHHL